MSHWTWQVYTGHFHELSRCVVAAKAFALQTQTWANSLIHRGMLRNLTKPPKVILRRNRRIDEQKLLNLVLPPIWHNILSHTCTESRIKIVRGWIKVNLFAVQSQMNVIYYSLHMHCKIWLSLYLLFQDLFYTFSTFMLQSSKLHPTRTGL